MPSFYIPSFENADADEFVDRYNRSYYLGEERIVPGVAQNSRFVEDEIDRLLREGIRNKCDVVHILAWKVGAIDHKGSDEAFAYQGGKDGWGHVERQVAENPALIVKLPHYSHDLELGRIAGYVSSNISELHAQSIQDPQGAQDVFNDLSSQHFKGLGATYLLTLLYFISQGEWPIYDRFAKKAIDAISHGCKPGTPITYKEPSVTKSVVLTMVADYKEQLVTVFGEAFGKDCYKNRKIDRALWVYGHWFHVG